MVQKKYIGVAVLIILIVISLYFSGILFQFVAIEPSVKKLVGGGNWETCRFTARNANTWNIANNNPITLPGIVTLNNFKLEDYYEEFIGCDDPDNLNFPLRGNCNDPPTPTGNTKTDKYGCLLKEYSYAWGQMFRSPGGSWWCNKNQQERVWRGGAKATFRKECNINVDVTNLKTGEKKTFNPKTDGNIYETDTYKVIFIGSSYSYDNCWCAMFDIKPRGLFINITLEYKPPPTHVFEWQVLSIKPKVIIDTNLQEIPPIKIQGIWTYEGGLLGTQSKKYETVLETPKKGINEIIVDIPTTGVGLLKFKLTRASFTYEYDIPNSWHPNDWDGKSEYLYNIDINLKESEILVSPSPLTLEEYGDCTKEGIECPTHYICDVERTKKCLREDVAENKLPCQQLGCPIVSGKTYHCGSDGTCDEIVAQYKGCKSDADCKDVGGTSCHVESGLCIRTEFIEKVTQCTKDEDCIVPCDGKTVYCGTDGKCHYKGECKVMVITKNYTVEYVEGETEIVETEKPSIPKYVYYIIIASIVIIISFAILKWRKII